MEKLEIVLAMDRAKFQLFLFDELEFSTKPHLERKPKPDAKRFQRDCY